MKLRQYQQRLKDHIYSAWSNGNKNVLAVLPCGGGKTIIFCKIIAEHKGACCVIAHRDKIICQISLALAREGIKHRIIGTPDLIKSIVSLHMMKLNKSFYDASSQIAVASVDTLIRRAKELSSWSRQVTLWVQDECHHVLKLNKWGRAVAMFPNAKGLGVTATPERLDGCGLGIDYHGVFYCIVQGPTHAELNEMGYLCDYAIFCPKNDLDVSRLTIGKTTKEYTPKSVKTEFKRTKIIGQTVEVYQEYVPGKLTVVFAPDVETCKDISQRFNDAGVPSEVIHANTGIIDRANIINRFENKELLVVINVGILGEGVDLPCVEVVIFAIPTKSFVRWYQAACRCLRIMQGKEKGIIIDQVGACLNPELGLPDAYREWSLSSNQSRGKSKNENICALRVCPMCTRAYEKVLNSCPNCGHEKHFENRTGAEFVDGDLTEIDDATLSLMRKRVSESDLGVEQYRTMLINRGCPELGIMRNIKYHKKRQASQYVLREWIKYWSGGLRSDGYDNGQIYTAFFIEFNIDVMSAMVLNCKNADKLTNTIRKRFNDI